MHFNEIIHSEMQTEEHVVRGQGLGGEIRTTIHVILVSEELAYMRTRKHLQICNDKAQLIFPPVPLKV